MAQIDGTDQPDQPAPGSHDRSTPTGTLEQSAANLFEAMLAARDAEASRADDRALRTFYRTLMTSTLLLPVPPDHGEEAKAALAAAVNDDEQVEISVMLAREGDGTPVSVVYMRARGLGSAEDREPASPGPDRDREPRGRGDAGDHGSVGPGAIPLRCR